MAAAAKQGLTQPELVEIDTHLRRLAEAQEFAMRLQTAGVADMTAELVGIQQAVEALTALKQEFAPMGPQVP